MSRSYKKNPIVKDNGESKKAKKTVANRRVRRKLSDPEYGMANGRAYRKEFESYDIADYVSRWTEKDAAEHWEKYHKEWKWFRENWPTLESYLTYWKKTYRNK